MRFPRLARWLMRALLTRVVMRRPPDFVVGAEDRPYLHRWYLIPRNPLFNVYLHCFLRSDDDRALHDHPWQSASLLLAGVYTEHTILAGGVNRRLKRERGALVFRSARRAHRIEIPTMGVTWTLFITGPRIRRWGFHCPEGWRYWEDFVAKRYGGNDAGRGCE